MLAIHPSVAGQEPFTLGNLVLEAPAGLDCGIASADLGLAALYTFHRAKLPQQVFADSRKWRLRFSIYRYAVGDGARASAPPVAGHDLKYRDIIAVSQFLDDDMAARTAAALRQMSPSARAVESRLCSEDAPETVTLYTAFADVGRDGRVTLRRDLLFYSRNVYLSTGTPPAVAVVEADKSAPAVPEQARTPAVAVIGARSSDDGPAPAVPPENTMSPSLPADGAPAPAEPAQAPNRPGAVAGRGRPPYAWVEKYDLSPGPPGEEVFAADRIDCETNENFIVGTIGTLVGSDVAAGPGAAPTVPPPADAALSVRRVSMIAVNNYVGKSGKASKQALVEKSVNSESYWCIPKREFCYQRVAFGDFGLQVRADDVSVFKPAEVASLRHGLLLALQRLLTDHCWPK